MAADLVTNRLRRAAELHQRAIEANNSATDPLRAARLVRRALRALDADWEVDPTDVPPDIAVLVAKIFITAAKSESELGGLDRGLAVLAKGAQIASRSPDANLDASIANQRGLLLQRAGLVDDAIAELVSAERRYRSAPPIDRCHILLNRGVARLGRGDIVTARSDFRRCADVAAQHALFVPQGMAEHNLGYAEYLAGNLASALDAMSAARRTSSNLPGAISALDRARVLADAGLLREADATLAEAAAIFARAGNTQDAAEAILERARCALVIDDVPAARRFAGRARDIFRRRGNDRWRRMAELVLLQGDLAAGRPGGRLIPPALRLRQEFEAVGMRVESAVAGLIAAEAALSLGESDAAAAMLSSIRRPAQRDPIAARLRDRYVRARIADENRQASAASRLVRSGLAELSEYQARFGSFDLQTAAAIHGRRLGELGVAMSLRVGQPDRILEAAERARAASSRVLPVRAPVNEDDAELVAELRQVIEYLQLTGADGSDASELRARRSKLEREIGARGWSRSGSGTSRPVARTAEIAHRLRGATLVSYIENAGVLHAVVLSHSAARHVVLGDSAPVIEHVRRLRADLDVLAKSLLPGAVRSAVESSARRSVDTLDNALVRPLGVEGDELVIVSTGVLGQLPWGLLPSLRGVPVVVAPSGTAWLAAAERRSRRAHVAVFAGPDLACGAREAAGVAESWKEAKTSSGREADVHRLRSALSEAALVHVAAHGVHNTENALFSSIRMTDGAFFAHELESARRTAGHVVLSACELGLAEVRPGDEGLGLTSVLLRLGTRSVVSGVARVNDAVAAEVMIDYHRRLAVGLDSPRALAEATAKAGDWAPFVCFGAAWRAPTSGFGPGGTGRVP